MDMGIEEQETHALVYRLQDACDRQVIFEFYCDPLVSEGFEH